MVEWVCARCHGEISTTILRLAEIPQAVRILIRAKCKRVGVSLRTLTLRLWKDWAARDGESAAIPTPEKEG